MLDKDFKITQAEIVKIIDKTVAVLPNNPSAAGYSAETIKKHMYQAIAGLKDGDVDNVVKYVNAHIDELVAEINTEITKINSTQTHDKEALQTDINSRVKQVDYNAKVSELQSGINSKVDKATYDAKVSELESVDTTDRAEAKRYTEQKYTESINYTENKVGDGQIEIFLKGTSTPIGSFKVNTNNYTRIEIPTDKAQFEDYTYSKEQIDSVHKIIEEMIAGKVSSFATEIGDDVTNPLNSQALSVILAEAETLEELKEMVLFTDISGNEIKVKDVKTAVNIFIKELNVPDRWIAIDETELKVYGFALETQKTDTSGFATKSELEPLATKEEVAELPTKQWIADNVKTGTDIYVGGEKLAEVDGKVDIPTKVPTKMGTKAVSKVPLSNFSMEGHTHSYNDLSDKPTIPSVDGFATETYVNQAIANAITSVLNTEV